MIYFFIISLGLLLGTLIASLFIRTQSKWLTAAVAAAGAAAFSAACALLFVHLAGNRAEFMHPWAFLLLVLPFGVFLAHTLLCGALTRRINYSMAHLKIEQKSLRVLFTRWLPVTIYTAALILMIIALARPVRVDRAVLPPSEGIDIILLMDVSASMQKIDFYPNRFIAAQQTADRFIAKRPNDRIGAVAFAKAAMLQAPLTLDHDALREYINSLYVGIVNPDYTAIGDAIGVAANHLKDSKAKSKIIILLTDGDSNAGTIEPLMAAKAAAAYGIRVYTVGTASAPDRNPYASSTDEINEGLMMEIASLTGGKYYRANNEKELAKIYDTINELEKTEFAPSATIHRTDYFQPVLLLALLCALLALTLEKLFLIKVP